MFRHPLWLEDGFWHPARVSAMMTGAAARWMAGRADPMQVALVL
jgi:hypothetical protein